jgi:hypothetical protein
LAPRKPETQPDLTPERAHAALSAQSKALDKLKGRGYSEAHADESEWCSFTQKMIIRSFGSDSVNVQNFVSCGYATSREQNRAQIPSFGDRIDDQPIRLQRNFEARLRCYEGVLRNCLAELQMDLPQAGIKGVYEPGQEYEFYRDLKSIVAMAQGEILVIDPYLNAEIFDVYASSIPRTVKFRLLSNNIPADVKALAQKYASGGNLQFRSSASVHDRVIFVDKRVWLSGQSIKDAAKKKPTYIVEHDEPLMREIYERIWQSASVVI